MRLRSVIRSSLLVWAAFCTLSCSRCGSSAKGGPADLLSSLTKSADAVLVVPDIAKLGEKLKILEQLKFASFAAQLQGFGNAQELTNNLVSGLGVDIRSKEALEEAGIAPNQGFGLVLLKGEQGYAVVGLKDAKVFAERVESLAKSRVGASVRQNEKQGAQDVTLFSRPGETVPRVGLLVKGNLAFLATGDSVKSLGTYAELAESGSLKGSEHLSAALGRLPAQRDGFVIFPAGGALTRAPVQDVVSVFSLEKTGFSIRTDVRWSSSREILKTVARASGPLLWNEFPADNFAVVRYGADPSKAGELLPHVVPHSVIEAFQSVGLDVRKDLADLLKAGALLGLSLAPTARLAGGIPALDIRRTNPFHYVQLTAIGEVVDAGKTAATLEKFPALGPKIGAKIEKSERLGQTVYVTQYSAGEGVHFALVKDKIVAAAPMARLEEQLRRVQMPEENKGAPDAAARKQLEAEALAFYIDLQALSGQVKALPAEAWGLGGFAIKAATERWLDATDDLTSVFGSVAATEGGIQTELALRFSLK